MHIAEKTHPVAGKAAGKAADKAEKPKKIKCEITFPELSDQEKETVESLEFGYSESGGSLKTESLPPDTKSKEITVKEGPVHIELAHLNHDGTRKAVASRDFMASKDSVPSEAAPGQMGVKITGEE